VIFISYFLTYPILPWGIKLQDDVKELKVDIKELKVDVRELKDLGEIKKNIGEFVYFL
jgi:hypothetical protein